MVPWARDRGCQGPPGAAGPGPGSRGLCLTVGAAPALGTRHLPGDGDGDGPGHQPAGGGQDPDPGGPGLGARVATALQDLELRRGPKRRGWELALRASRPGSGKGHAVRALPVAFSLVILLYNLHTVIFLTGHKGDRDRGEGRRQHSHPLETYARVSLAVLHS